VERLHDHLERSFLPGRMFGSPTEFHAQLQTFLAGANTRQHRALGCRPADRVDADRAAMVAVPPVVGWRQSTRQPRDHYQRLDSNDYSVHPTVIGRRVEVSADLERVRVFGDGQRACQATGTQGLAADGSTAGEQPRGRIGRPRKDADEPRLIGEEMARQLVARARAAVGDGGGVVAEPSEEVLRAGGGLR
jgi:hypothetical protein